jgi:hypothetical protein
VKEKLEIGPGAARKDVQVRVESTVVSACQVSVIHPYHPYDDKRRSEWLE